MNNKSADQTARIRRLICAFVVRIWQKQVFSGRGSYDSETICPNWEILRNPLKSFKIKSLKNVRVGSNNPGHGRLLVG